MITSSWPVVPSVEAPHQVRSLQEIVTGVRSFRTQHQIPRSTEIPVTVVADELVPPWWLDQLSSLGDCTPSAGDRPDPVAGYSRLSGGGVEAFIPLDGIIDVHAERPRIVKVIAGLESSIARSRGKLDNPDFRDRAPAEVIEQEETRLAEVEAELAKQQRQLAELG